MVFIECLGTAEIDMHYLAFLEERADEEVQLNLKTPNIMSTTKDETKPWSAVLHIRMSYTKI